MQYIPYSIRNTYNHKENAVYLKFKFNGVSCIFIC